MRTKKNRSNEQVSRDVCCIDILTIQWNIKKCSCCIVFVNFILSNKSMQLKLNQFSFALENIIHDKWRYLLVRYHV